MEQFIEVIKNIATVVGCLVSCVTLVAIIIKPLRKAILKRIMDIANTKEIEKQSKEISEVEQKIGSMKSDFKKQTERQNDKIDEINKTLQELLDNVFCNEKDRLRGELFNCGNRCRRHIPLSLEEYRYIQTVGDKYLHKLHCNSIGEAEYKFITEYFESFDNQEAIKKNK